MVAVSANPSSVRKGLLYACAAAGLGGALWSLMLLLAVPARERFSALWWAVGAAAAFWVAVGFIIGAFGPSTGANLSAPESKQKGARLGLRSVLTFLGFVVYRGLIGYLVGGIITSAYALLAVGLAISLKGYLASVKGPLDFVVTSALSASVCGGILGAMFGAWWAPVESPGSKQTSWVLAKTASIGNLLGIAVAAHFGAVWGTIIDLVYGDEAFSESDDYVFVEMAIGGGAGILAGVLAGFWSRLHRKWASRGPSIRPE